MTASARLPRDGAKLRKTALGYPEAYEEMPWGHHAIKVKGKAFVFLAADQARFSLSPSCHRCRRGPTAPVRVAD